MDNLNNPSDVPSDSHVRSVEAENVNDNPTNGTLAEINKATGRDYATLDDATKGMSETYNFVGSLGEVKDKATKYDEIQAGKSAAEQAKDRDADKWEKFDKQSFLYNNKDAAGVADDVYAIAKSKGVTMEQAYNDSPLKGFIDKQVAEQEPARGALAPSGAIAGGVAGGPLNAEEFNRLPLEEQRKVIGALETSNHPVGRGVYHSTQRNA